MKNLIICGKGPISSDELNLDDDIWMLGTDNRTFGDVYFELHGIIIKSHDNVIYNLPEKVYSFGLPINNSISALCVYAWLLGYVNVTILGCPMDACDEYKLQKPALAYCIGWLNAKGMNITWKHLPKNKNYGKQADN